MQTVRVIVGSSNRVKIIATKRAFAKYYSASVRGVEVDSGVPSQPFDKQVFEGATNRAKEAMKLYQTDFAVGIEGGVKVIKNASFAFAIVCIMDKKGKSSMATTGFFPIPNEAISLVYKGKELGEAMDIISGDKDVKRKYGAVGLLTKGVIDRIRLYEHAVVLALIPHVNRNLTWS
ncbi:MAG: inosine/xanthosine triphosphatase [Nitrososphaerota archaeon]